MKAINIILTFLIISVLSIKSNSKSRSKIKSKSHSKRTILSSDYIQSDSTNNHIESQRPEEMFSNEAHG